MIANTYDEEQESMTRAITIHKPSHKWFAAPGTLAIAIGQLRGKTLFLNRIDPSSGKVIEKSVAYAASYDLTGYGEGVPANNERRVAAMQGAWHYQFGDAAPLPAFCEKHAA